MSATNHTTNYEFPIFIGTDKPAWLVDWNEAMTAIDTAIHTAEGKADQAGTDIGGIESSISTINSTLTSINNAVSQLRIDTNANTGSINTITSLIGNGQPTTTDKTLIGAINEINERSVYSTSEKVVGTWVDDSVLYARVFTGTTESSAGQTEVATLDESVIPVGIEAYIKYDDGSIQAIPYNNGYNNSAYVVTNHKLYVLINESAYTDKSYIVVVRYIKSA